MKRRVLITGSSGMLGIDLCRELKPDYDVIGLDMVRHPKSGVKKFFLGDITDRKSVAAIVAAARPDFVVHAAAWTDVDGCELDSKRAYRVNSEGAENIASACKEAGAALIYISTDFVFDGRKRSPYKETDRTGPLSIYGASKLRGEVLVSRILDRYFILRTSWLYGKCGKNFVDTIVAKAKATGSLKVVRDQAGSPTYTKHLAKAIRRLLDRADVDCRPETVDRRPKTIDRRPETRDRRPKTMDYGLYHVSNSGKVSWYDYARMILKLVKSKAEVAPITSRQLARPAKRPAMSVMDNSKFVRFTGYRMPGWQAALKEYLT